MQARAKVRAPGARWRACLIAFLLFLATVGARVAHADDHAPLVLRYTAPPACPGAERFLGEVAARTSFARPAQPNEPATTLTVNVGGVAGGYKGTLDLQSVDGGTSARQVSASECEQVVSALALMTALALDPNASTASVATRASIAKPPPRVSPPLPKNQTAKDATKDTAERERAPEPHQPSTPRKWRFQFGTALEALGGAAPEPVLLVRPFAELASGGASRWSAAFRFSAGLGRKLVRTGEAGADFVLFTGRLEGCPARFRAAWGFRLSPCLALDVGRLQATGVGITPTERAVAPWVAPGFVGRLEWEIVNRLVIGISGEALFPVVRDRFFVNTDATLHRTPAVAGGAAAELGVRFP